MSLENRCPRSYPITSRRRLACGHSPHNCKAFSTCPPLFQSSSLWISIIKNPLVPALHGSQTTKTLPPPPPLLTPSHPSTFSSLPSFLSLLSNPFLSSPFRQFPPFPSDVFFILTFFPPFTSRLSPVPNFDQASSHPALFRRMQIKTRKSILLRQLLPTREPLGRKEWE